MRRLYVIGVGPGAPDLVTLRAVDRLKRSQVVFCPVRSPADESLAYETVKPHLKSGIKVVKVHFPMTKDRDILQEAWSKVAKTIEEEPFSEASFVVIGDPSFYCTFFYVYPLLRDVEIEVVPGVASFSACCASLKLPLVLGGESLLVMSGAHSLEKERADALVIMKPPRDAEKRRALVGFLKDKGYSKVFFARRCQMEGEEITSDLPEDYDYISMLIAKA